MQPLGCQEAAAPWTPAFLWNICVFEQFAVYVVFNLREGGSKSQIGRGVTPQKPTLLSRSSM